MFRFISFLLNKPYESCKSCETLKEQLEFARAEKRELLTTLTSILKPTAFIAPVTELEPITPKALTFTRKRAALEARDREEARIKVLSKNLGKSDAEIAQAQTRVVEIKTSDEIQKLEQELGIEEHLGVEANG